MIGSPLLLFVLLAADDKPAPKLPIGKETTYVTGPVDKNGFIDYESALNDRLGAGITPERNANVLLWKALGPRPEGGAGMPAEFFKRLGMNELPERGDYLIGLSTFLKDHVKLDKDEFEIIYHQQSRAVKRAWTAKDYPHLAAWLKANEKPLALTIEAVKRPDYLNPLVSRPKEKGPGGLMGALMPGVQKCRDLASALAARAMLRVAEGQLDQAWQDLLACHRLGRLVGRGATMIEALVSIAIDHIASNADLAYLERAPLTAAQVRERLKDLQGLPPMPTLADKIDLGERLMFLDGVQMVRRGGLGMLEALSGGPAAQKPDAKEQEALAAIDWEPALRNGNRWYDRLVVALRIKDRASREKKLDGIEKDLEAMKQQAVNRADLFLGLLGGGNVGKNVGKAIGDVLIALMMPAIRKVQGAVDRSEQVQRNLHVAFALAAFSRDHGRYPAKLDDLAPTYLASISNDIFSGKPLIFRRTEKGYLLYSVGLNGSDDEGRWTDDDPPGDDLAVRMPLPALKPNK
jgi:hypothetical protein